MNALSNVRILMTADTVGGVWTYATALAERLAVSGAHVHLVTIGPPPRPDQRAMLSAGKVQIIESELTLEWQDPAGKNLGDARSFFERTCRRLKPDLVHLNSFREATFDWHVPVLVTAHSCANSWGVACHDMEWLRGPDWRCYTGFVRAGLHQASAWVAPTRAFREIISAVYRPAAAGTVIWNGIELPAAPPTQKQQFVLAAGRMWDTAKNLQALSSAARGLDWPVLVAGRRAEGRDQKSSEIEFLGDISRDDLLLKMQGAAIFASPALYEPFGLAVLEAASRGCALVLSDIASFRELWDGAALFVDPSDPQGLHHALVGLCTDEPRRVWLQRTAFARAQLYSLARTAEAYQDLYAGLLASKPILRPTHAVEACA
jgi:glycosyltransferase involved in cell wall biosynthesis